MRSARAWRWVLETMCGVHHWTRHTEPRMRFQRDCQSPGGRGPGCRGREQDLQRARRGFQVPRQPSVGRRQTTPRRDPPVRTLSRPGLVVGILRVLCNGLCTARRCHSYQDDQRCRMGCPDEAACVRHYDVCPRGCSNMCLLLASGGNVPTSRLCLPRPHIKNSHLKQSPMCPLRRAQ